MGGLGHGGGGRAAAGGRDREGGDLERTLSAGPFRLLALDIDGTLLRSDKTISPRTRAALDAAAAAGVRRVLVTGRRYPAARKIADLLGGPLDLVLHNGALIVENGEVLRCRPLDCALAQRVIALGRAAGADPVVHAGQAGEGRLLVEGWAESNTMLHYYLDKSHPDVTVVEVLEESLVDDPLQVMFGGPLRGIEELWQALTAEVGEEVRIERTFYPHLDAGFLDVLAPAVNKAEALAFLQERWDVTPAHTLAIGDNWNDHEMLERAGLGMVMGNADPRMRELGLPVLPTNDEDGVALAVERYVLERMQEA
jgi:Cof subfamily protein (haloacid dehalogenase superfamily)